MPSPHSGQMEWIKMIPIRFKHVPVWVVTALLVLTLTGMNCVAAAPPELSLVRTSTNCLFTPLMETPKVTLHQPYRSFHPATNLRWAKNLAWTEVATSISKHTLW